jgi:ferredoxin
MKIKIDRSKCAGIGRCEAIAPKIFQVDDQGYLYLLQGEDVPGEEQDDVMAAITQCPRSALSRG